MNNNTLDSKKDSSNASTIMCPLYITTSTERYRYQMDVTLTVDESIDDFRETISHIEGGRAANKRIADELKELGDVNPGLPSLQVHKYTFGPSFFGYRYSFQDPYDSDEHKLVLAKSFLQRTNIHQETLALKFREWKTEAFPELGINSEYLNRTEYFKGCQLFVVECLFIIEVIRRYTCGDEKDAADGLSSIGLLLQARRDMIVNGNQLPFSVLEALFNFAFPEYEASTDRNFLKLCVVFFSECMLITEYSQVSSIIHQLQQQRTSGSEIKDFLDLLRKCHAPMFPRQPPIDKIKSIAMRKASYIQEAGIAIRPSPTDLSICSLCYSEGLLEIPKIKINRNSRHLLTNLMEFEKRHYPQDTFITDYLHFMDRLIDTAQDVDVLINNEILDSYVQNGEEVAALFNTITKEAPLTYHNYYYHGISEAANAYCRIPHHRWKAMLIRDYFSSPWIAASTITAIVLLGFTLIRTLWSIISSF